MLAFLLLAGLLLSWGQVRATPLASAGSELGGFAAPEVAFVVELPGASAHDVDETDEVCRKPASVNTAPVDLVLNEISDKDVQSPTGRWPVVPQAAPRVGPQPELPQNVREPLLRPPATLG